MAKLVEVDYNPFEKPSVLADVAKALPSGVAEGFVKAPLWAADLANAAAQGVTRIGGRLYQLAGGEMSPETARELTDYKPFYGSDELIINPLKQAGVDFYEPKTTAGTVAGIIGEMAGYGSAEKAVRSGVGKLSGSGQVLSGKASEYIAVPAKESLPKPMQKVYDRLRADYPDNAEFNRVLNSYMSKQGEALIQRGGEKTKNLAEGAAMFPSGGAKAGEFFEGAVSQAPERLKAAASKTISPKIDYFAEAKSIVEKGREKAAPLYKKAYSANQSVSSKLIDNILETPEGQGALREAVKNVRNEITLAAKPDPELTALARDLERVGKVTGDTAGGVSGGLKLRTLDYVKRSMDDTINRAYNRGDAAQATRINNLKKALVKELDSLDKTGAYAKARSVSGDYLSTKDAIEQGARFLNDDADVIANMVKGFSKSEKQAYNVGALRSIRNKIEKTTDGSNVARLFNNQASRNKLRKILNESDYNKLLNQAKEVDSVYRLRNQLTGNSRTAMRQIAASEFDDVGTEVIQEIATRGWANVATDKVFSAIGRLRSGLSDKSAGDVMDILLETDPKKKYQIVKSLTIEANKPNQTIAQEAAKKLGVFYKLSDEVSKAGAKYEAGAIGNALQNESGSIRMPVAIGLGAGGAVAGKLIPVDYNPFEQQQPETITTPAQPFDTMPAQGESTLKRQEGLRLSSYNDTVGKRTVGYGFNMQSGIARKVWERAGVQTKFEDVFKGRVAITPQEAENLFYASYQIAADDARKVYPAFDRMPAPRQEALLSLSYQLGINKLKNRPYMQSFNHAINKGDMGAAITALRKSPLAEQTPNRVKEIASLLLRSS